MAVNPNFTLAFSLICATLHAVDNYVSSAGACSRFSFLGLAVRPMLGLFGQKHLLQNQAFMKCKFVNPLL
jgi:hypothetical protein